MRPTENIERRIENVRIAVDAEANDRVFGSILQAFKKSEAKQPAATQPNLWRIIMKSKITKLAAAAAIIMTLALSMTFLDKSVTSAYAIEQTIEASRDLRFLYFEYFGRSDDEAIKECWIEFDPNGKPKNVRTNLHAHWQIVHVWKEGKTQTWLKEKNTLRTYEDDGFTAKTLKLVRDCDPRTAVESLYERERKGDVKIEIEQPADKKSPIVIKGTFLPGKYLLDNPTLPSFRNVLYVDQTTKLVTGIEVYELENGKYEYNGVWRCYKQDQPFEASIFDLEDEAPADAKRLTTMH
jgi:hypothetical protein